MNQKLIDEIAYRLERFPLYSQEDADGNPVIAAKAFNAAGAGTWWFCEYDPFQCLAFGYVTGLGEDEWGYVSLDELAAVNVFGWHCIEVDEYFTPTRFKDLRLPA